MRNLLRNLKLYVVLIVYIVIGMVELLLRRNRKRN